MKAGSVASLPELPGRWSVWSKSDETPGAHFFVPLDDPARASGVKYAVVRVTNVQGVAEPRLSVLRTEAATQENTP